MQLRTVVRSVSAAAVAGGLTLGLGVSSPATAMPVHDRAESLGRLCHAAAQARATEPGAAPSSIEGLPGLRCGQAFGRAALAGDDAEETAYDDEPTYIDATEAEDSKVSDEAPESDDDSDASDEALEPDDADAYREQSDDADWPEESHAYESDEAADDSDSSESEDSEDSAEQEDSEESHEQEDADYDDGGDDVDDGTEHSEHHDD